MSLAYPGRYNKVRSYSLASGVWSPPFVIDRRCGAAPRIEAYRGHGEDRDAWDLLLDRPTRRGLFSRNEVFVATLFADTTPALTSVALDSAYTVGSAGDAVGVRFRISDAKTLDTVYFYISSFTGTAANVNDLTLELRTESSAGANTPSTGAATESKVYDPLSTTGWHAVTGWATALSAGDRRWMSIADPDGGAVDFANVGYRVTSAMDSGQGGNKWTARWFPLTTANGWSTATSATAQAAAWVFKWSDGSVVGWPLTGSAAATSNALQRGASIASDSLNAPLDIFGMTWSIGNASLSGMKIWAGATGPTGTADHISTDIAYASASSRAGCFVSGGANYRLATGTLYRIVATCSGTTTAGPQQGTIGTGADATLKLAMPGGGKIYYTQEDAGPGWTDTDSSLPLVSILLDADIVPAGGGGGGGVIGGPNMRGGMSA